MSLSRLPTIHSSGAGPEYEADHVVQNIRCSTRTANIKDYIPRGYRPAHVCHAQHKHKTQTTPEFVLRWHLAFSNLRNILRLQTINATMPNWAAFTRWTLAGLNFAMAKLCIGFAIAIILDFRGKLNKLQAFWRQVPLEDDSLSTDLGLPYRDFGAVMWAIIAMLFLASALNFIVVFFIVHEKDLKQDNKSFGLKPLRPVLHVAWFVGVGGCAATAGLSYIMSLAIWQWQQDGQRHIQSDTDWHKWWQIFLVVFAMSLFNVVVLVGGGVYDCKLGESSG